MSTDQPVVHELKVVPPYFDALCRGTKTFEVRRNDRAYQAGDGVRLRLWHPEATDTFRLCPHGGCTFYGSANGHYGTPQPGPLERTITFVYSGDPRFGGIESGYVVLALVAAGLGVTP
jgi:hypothetical protein